MPDAQLSDLDAFSAVVRRRSFRAAAPLRACVDFIKNS
jgi:hypothetical protein